MDFSTRLIAYVRNLFQRYSNRNVLLVSLGIVSLIFSIIIFSLFSRNNFHILYTDLQSNDSANILKELELNRIKYEISEGGKTIKVPKEDLVKVRIHLSQLGIPNSGSLIGYEIFDKEDSISTTSFSQNIKLIRALEGELSRTIAAFEKINSARVHLVMPQKEIFSKDRSETKVSVMLKLVQENLKLNKSEIKAISHLLLTSVPGLESKNLSIVDNKGNTLKASDLSEDYSTNFFGDQNDEFKLISETRLKNTIEELLNKVLGPGKVKASVSLDINFDRIITNSELYDPENQVIRSSQITEEKEQLSSSSSDDISVQNNIQQDSAQEDGVSPIIVEKTEQQTNYEISKTIKNHIIEPGSIKRMYIGVLVDGEYITNPETQETEYKERSKEELEKILNLVKVSVGFNDERNDQIEVINMKFSSEETSLQSLLDKDMKLNYLYNIIKILIIAVSIIVLALIIKPLFKNLLSKLLDFSEIKQAGTANNKVQDTDALEEKDIIQELPNIEQDIDTYRTLKKKINDIANKNPQQFASTLQSLIDLKEPKKS